MRFYLAAVCALIWGCSGGPSAGALSLKLAAGDSYSLTDLAARLAKAPSSALTQTIQRATVSDLYTALLNHTTDNPFVVDGHVLSGVHSALLAAAPLFNDLNRRYPNWASQAAASAISFETPPAREEIEPAFAKLASDYSQTGGPFTATQDIGVALALNSIKDAGRDAATDKEAEPAQGLPLTDESESLRNLAAVASLAVVGTALSSSDLGLVTNSAPQCDGFHSVQALEFKQGSSNKECTGTFINGDSEHDYMLTAAHCASDGSSGFWTTNRAGAKVYAQSAIYESAFGSDPANGSDTWRTTSQYDQAVITFPTNTASAYSPLATDAPLVGTPVVLGGYGNSSQTGPTDSGTLRCGNNNVQSSTYEQAMVQLSGIATSSSSTVPAGTQSLGAPADSGGPIFNTGGQIIGTLSNSPSDPDKTTSVSQYVPVYSTASKAFVTKYANLSTSSSSQNTSSTEYPYCTNGSDTGNGFGWQPGIGGPNNGSCRVPQ